MELEGLKLDSPEGLFGDEGEGGEEESNLEGDTDLFSGGESGGDEGGGDEGGMASLFAGENRGNQLMSEEDIDKLNDVIEEFDKNDILGKNKMPINPSKNVKRGINRRNTKRSSLKDVGFGLNSHGIENIDPGAGLGKLSKADKPISAGDLFDSVMPQSAVINDYIDKSISYRLSKDLDNMSNKLNIKTNKLLKESNDNDYDIFIDDDLLKEKDSGDGEDA
jgi:hypothetical protein